MVDAQEDAPAIAGTSSADAEALAGKKSHWRNAAVVIVLAVGALTLSSTLRKSETASTRAPNDPAKAEIAQQPLAYTTDDAIIPLTEDDVALGALTTILSKAEWPTPRGEFETSAEYRKRLADFNRPIGEFPRSTPFVVIVPADAKYDADLKTLTLQTSTTTLDEIPSVVLESNTAAGSDYVGQNAFGVKTAVSQTVTTQVILIPLARLTGPSGCDFAEGDSDKHDSGALVNADALISWACGRYRLVDPRSIENVSSYTLNVDRNEAKDIASRPIKIAYVVSFDGLPSHGPPLIGPMEFRNTQPTINLPHRFRVIGHTQGCCIFGR